MTLLSIPKTTPEIVKAVRSAKKLSVRELAAELGVSYEMIYRYEDGRAEPHEANIKAWLYSGTDWISELAIEIVVARYRHYLTAPAPVAS